MRRAGGLIAAAALLCALAGAGGGWLGVQYGLHQERRSPGLDDVLHHQLHLTTDQAARIAAMERNFAAQKALRDQEMEAADRDLAAALAIHHAYGPDAESAVARFHLAMGRLQTQTIQHVLAMRTVLTPRQAVIFDRSVSQTLAPSHGG